MRAPGRDIEVGEACRKLNPHIFGPSDPPLIKNVIKIGGVPVSKPATRIRQDSKPLLNKLETDALRWLEARYPGTPFYKQAMRWRLGNGIWYKPDLEAFVMNPLADITLTCWEVKGPHAFRGGFENLKVAAGLYPAVWWRLIWKDNGQWCEQAVLP